MYIKHIATQALLAQSLSALGSSPFATARNLQADVPCDGAQTSKVLQPTDSYQVVGCESPLPNADAAYDGAISDFVCNKISTEKFGQIIVSNPDRFSIVEGFRLYASTSSVAGGANLDPIQYKVEGRGGGSLCYHVNDPGVEEPQDGGDVTAQAREPFKILSKGTLPNAWVNGNTPPDRNTAGEAVDDSYNKGTSGLSYTAVRWKNDGTVLKGKPVQGAPLEPSECRDYRISFEGGRDGGDQFAFGEIELVGTVTSACSSGPVTRAPSKSPTKRPTEAPNNPACPDEEVANTLLPDDTVEIEGCLSATSPENAFDGTTAPFSCTRNTTAASNVNGIIVSNLRKTSIATGLRVYSNPTDAGKDPVQYKVEGREGPNCYRVNSPGVADAGDVGTAAALQTWRVISKGELPWAGDANFPRNGANEDITSDFAMGDTNLQFTAVSWTNDGTVVAGEPAPSECRDYRITFDTARDDSQDVIEIGEVELVGIITDSCSLTAPTSAPFGCSALTRRRTCKRTDGCGWSSGQCLNE